MNSNFRHQPITHDHVFNGLNIMVDDDSPVFTNILDKTYTELTSLLAIHTRVVLVRLDLVPPANVSESEIDFNKFIKNTISQLKRDYESEVAYLWVKEYGKKNYNNGLHYHVWFAVKCTKSKPHTQYEKMQITILDKWNKVHNIPRSQVSKRTHKSGWFYLQRNELNLDSRKTEQLIISKPREENVLICI